MPEQSQPEVVPIEARLIDDAYMAWCEAESEAEMFLQAWFASVGERREVAYLGYRAALEREEASARELQRLWGLASSSHEAPVGEPRERAWSGEGWT